MFYIIEMYQNGRMPLRWAVVQTVNLLSINLLKAAVLRPIEEDRTVCGHSLKRAAEPQGSAAGALKAVDKGATGQLNAHGSFDLTQDGSPAGLMGLIRQVRVCHHACQGPCSHAAREESD